MDKYGLKSCQSYVKLLPERRLKGRWNGHINNMIMAEILKIYMAGFSRHHVEVGIYLTLLWEMLLYNADQILFVELLCL